MKIRAVLFDVYNTLLAVGPPPSDAAGRWEALWQGTFSVPPRLTLQAFDAECLQITAREHAAARALGIAYPEVYWNAVTREAAPELDRLEDSALEEFLFAHAQMQRTLQMMPEVLHLLHSLLDRQLPLGLVSNSQPYTLFELAAALESANLGLANFQPDLCFLSYKNGFSKPDPHAYRLMAARLKARGIEPGETLMVGDRLDNDIEPARAQGFQTWQLTAVPTDQAGAGNWSELAGYLSVADG